MAKNSSTRRRRQAKQNNNAFNDQAEKSNGEISGEKKNSSGKNSLFRLVGTLICSVVLLVTVASVILFKDITSQQDASTERDSSSTKEKQETDAVTPTYRGHYELLETFPHDPNAFTQGLTFANGNLYEGTGLYGQSEIRHVDPQTGKVLKSHRMRKELFGEGIAHFNNDEGDNLIIQLTWREQIGFIYNAETFDVVREFQYNTTTNEGWGITYDEAEKEFIVSDGSEWLHFWDRDTLEEKRRVQVLLLQHKADSTGAKLLQRQPVKYLNEIELDERGSILSNVWYQDVLVRIDLVTGHVQLIYYFPTLYTDRVAGADCFNGISLTDRMDEFYVTGKNWPHMYRIKLS